MEHLPPVGWADVATKDDLRSLETRLDSSIHVLGSDFRTEMASLGSDLHVEMSSLGSDLRTEMANLGSDLRAEMANLTIDVHSTLRANAYLTIGAIAASAGLLGAITSLS